MTWEAEKISVSFHVCKAAWMAAGQRVVGGRQQPAAPVSSCKPSQLVPLCAWRCSVCFHAAPRSTLPANLHQTFCHGWRCKCKPQHKRSACLVEAVALRGSIDRARQGGNRLRRLQKRAAQRQAPARGANSQGRKQAKQRREQAGPHACSTGVWWRVAAVQVYCCRGAGTPSGHCRLPSSTAPR